MTPRFHEKAESDLVDIWSYISQDSEEAAAKTIDEIRESLKTLKVFANAGRERPELGEGTRSWPIGMYVAYYRIVESEPQVVRILHGSMDLQAQGWDFVTGPQ